MHFAPLKQTKTTPKASSHIQEYSSASHTTPSQQAIQRIEDKSSASRFPAGSIHQTASQGVKGSGQRLPYLNQIQAAFGKHDVSHVQAYTGSQAQTASKAIGAEAYTTGNKVAFASSNPSLHTAAHETAHVIQQQARVQLKGGVGEVGDPYERQADQVADAVVKGRSAENLLNLNNNGALAYSPSTMQPIQRKLIINNTVSTTTVPSAPLPPSTTIDKSNVVREAGSYAETFSKRPEIIKKEISKASIEKYLKEFVDIVGDKETFQFEDAKLEEYIISRHLKGNMFEGLDEEIKYITFKTYITGKKDYYAYSSTGFREALFDPTYLYPGYETSKSISPILTANLAKSAPTGGYTAEGFGKPPLRTKIAWSKEANNMGVKMKADPLGPDHPQGQDTSKTDTKSEKAREDFDILTGNGNKSGHLLNDQLGGPARVYNLAPITTSANRYHETRAEDPVKELVHDEHTWVWYEVEMQQNDMDATRFAKLYGKVDATTAERPTTADARKKATPEQKKQAAEALNKKYVDKLTVNWGQVDINGAHIGSTHVVTLLMEDPLKAKYSPTATPNLKSKPSNPSSIGHRSTLKPYNFTLEKESSTTALIETITKFLKDFTDAKLDATSLKQNLVELQSALKNKITAKIDAKLKEATTDSGLKELYDIKSESNFYNTAVQLFNTIAAEATEYDDEDKFFSQANSEKEAFLKLSADIVNFNIADFAKRFVSKYKAEIFKEHNGDISSDKGREIFDMFFENYAREASRDTQAKKLHELNVKMGQEWGKSLDKAQEEISEKKRKYEELQDESTRQRQLDLLNNLKSNKENFGVSFDHNANKKVISTLVEELSYSREMIEDMYNKDLDAKGGLDEAIEDLESSIKNPSKKRKLDEDTPMSPGI